MKHPKSRELYSYWDMLRGARVAPERSDLDPAAIRGVLADTFVLAIDAESSAHGRKSSVRLSGTRLNALFLSDLKGRSFLELWKAIDRSVLDDILSCVLDDRFAMVAHVKTSPTGHAAIDLELLLLPLRHHGKTHVRLLGSLAPMIQPPWIGLLPVEPLSLASFRQVPRQQVHDLTPATSPSGPEACLAMLPPPKRHGRFTIYDGGR